MDNRSRSKASYNGVLAVMLCKASALAAAGTDLSAIGLEELMALKVVGASKYEQSQNEVAASVSVITREDIRSFGWRTLDEALATLPGTHVTYDRQYKYLGTRGFGLPGDFNTRVLITINGNRVNDSTFDAGQVGRQFPLDMDLIERIELIPGPGGAVYGQNAMFGVVNVVTRTGQGMDATELALRAQRPQGQREQRVSFGRRLDNGLDVLLSASTLNARGQDHFQDFGAAGVSGLARGMDGERDRELFARLGLGPWSMELVNGNERKDDPTAGYLGDPLVPGAYQRDRYTLAQLQYQGGQPSDALQFHARLFAGQQRYAGQFFYGTPTQNPALGDWRGAEGRLLYNGLADHKVLLGVEVQDNLRAQQQFIDAAHPARNITIESPGWRTGIYVQDQWQLDERISATLGLRVDRNDSTGTQTSPRLGLIWQPWHATTFKTLYGKAHRAPNAFERDYGDGVSQVGNPALRGESIDTLELVADHRVGNDLLLRASVYSWRMSELIVLGIDPATGLTQYQSGGRVRATGMELSADKFWSWGARLRGSVSMQHARDAGDRAQDANGSKVVNSPSLLGKLNLSAPLPWAGLRLGYELQFSGRRSTLAGSHTGGYAVSNLHLGTERLWPGLELGLTVRNLFDKRYAHPAADSNWQDTLAQDGRSVCVAARYRF
jgi:iron complex outermembrane receptor protein